MWSCSATVVCAAKHERGVLAQDAAIDPEFDVGMEHGEERLEVAVACGGEERGHDLCLLCQVGVRLGSPERAAARGWRAAGRRPRSVQEQYDVGKR